MNKRQRKKFSQEDMLAAKTFAPMLAFDPRMTEEKRKAFIESLQRIWSSISGEKESTAEENLMRCLTKKREQGKRKKRIKF